MRRSCTRTGKPTQEALTAGSQMRVRKVLREIGVPALVANSASCLMPFAPIAAQWSAHSLELMGITEQTA